MKLETENAVHGIQVCKIIFPPIEEKEIHEINGDFTGLIWKLENGYIFVVDFLYSERDKELHLLDKKRPIDSYRSSLFKELRTAKHQMMKVIDLFIAQAGFENADWTCNFVSDASKPKKKKAC